MLIQSVDENEKRPLRVRFTRQLLATLGWKFICNTPADRKYVVICAPHTSLWDYPLFLFTLFSIDNNCRWLAHAQFFNGLCGPVTRFFGGFELTKDPKTSFVKKVSDVIGRSESLAFFLTPEGSRSFVPRWRTGFYYISLTANVPIALGFIDYKNKTLGIGEHFTPTGNIEKDLRIIRNFYRNITPKDPDRVGLIKL